MMSKANEFEEVDDDMEMEDIEQESAPLFWSLKLTPNQPIGIDQPSIPGYIVHVTHACFGPSVEKGSRSVVMVNTNESPEDASEESPICVLKQGSNENQQLDLLFNEEAYLTVKGNKPSNVYLTGYLQPPVDNEDAMDPFMEDYNQELEEQLLRKQAMAEEEEEEAPELVDDEDDEDEDTKIVPPPQKKQKTSAGAKATKQQNGNAQKRKSPQNKPVKAPKSSKTTTTKITTTETTTTTTKTDEDDTKSAEENKDSKKKNKKNKKRMQNMKGGIKYKDMKIGEGKAIQNGQSVKVFYVGQLDDKKVFDKSIHGDGFEFTLGKGDVIKGWDMGLKGMKVGGKRKLIVPAKLAYGASGSPPQIPPNAQLTFTIEVRAAN